MANTRMYTFGGIYGSSDPFIDILIPEEVTANRAPTGVSVYSSRAEAFGPAITHFHISHGVSDFVNEFVNHTSFRHDDFVSNLCARRNNHGFVAQLTNSGNNNLQRSWNAEARVGGVRLIADQTHSQATAFKVTLIFGSACYAFSEGDNLVQFEELVINHPFATAPKLGIYSCASRGNNQTTHHRVGYGFHAIGPGDVLKQRGIGLHNLNNELTEWSSLGQGDKCVNTGTPATTPRQAWQITDINENDVTYLLTNSADEGDILGLLIEVDDTEVDLQIIAAPISDSSDWVISSLPWKPQFVSLIATGSKVPTGDDEINQPDTRFGFLSVDALNAFTMTGMCSTDLTDTLPTAASSRVVDDGWRIEERKQEEPFALQYSMGKPVLTDNGWEVLAADIDAVDTDQKYFFGIMLRDESDEDPVISNAEDNETGETTSVGQVDTDKLSNGGIFAVVTQSDITPTHAQITAGQDHTGAMADASNAIPAEAANPQVLNFTGLAAGTDYFTHFTQEDFGDLESNQLTADGFTTTTDNQPPVAEGDIPDQVCTIGEVYPPLDTAPFFSDPDGDPLTHTQDNLPNGLDIDEAGLITGTPTGGFPFIETNTVIAGLDGDFRGFALAPVTGSINPATFGLESISKFGNTIAPSTPDMVFEVVGIDFEETSWKQIEIVGDFGSGIEQKTWFRVADNFVYDGNVGGNSQWRSVAGVAPLLDGEIYLIQIVATVITE